MHKYKLEKNISSVQNADSGSNSGTDLGGGELIRPRRVVGVHVVVDHMMILIWPRRVVGVHPLFCSSCYLFCCWSLWWFWFDQDVWLVIHPLFAVVSIDVFVDQWSMIIIMIWIWRLVRSVTFCCCLWWCSFWFLGRGPPPTNFIIVVHYFGLGGRSDLTNIFLFSKNTIFWWLPIPTFYCNSNSDL